MVLENSIWYNIDKFEYIPVAHEKIGTVISVSIEIYPKPFYMDNSGSIV